MSKNYYHIGVILALMAAVLLGVAPVTAAEKTEFTCTETYVATLDPGSWTFPDGNIHIRGMVLLLYDQASDSRLDGGYNTVVLNANWQADETGPMWGTFRIETSEGGWGGRWAGQMTGQGSWFNAVGDGFGEYDGMKMWWDKNYDDCRGKILEH